MNGQKFVITEEMLASKSKRFANHILDLIPQFAVTYGIAYGFFYIGEFTGNYALSDFWSGLSTLEDYMVSYGLMILYYFIFESLTYKTLGKYATNTKVVMHNGEAPTPKILFIRTLCRLIPFDALSFLGSKGKGWHDNLSKTYVIDIAIFESRKTMFTELDQIGLPVE